MAELFTARGFSYANVYSGGSCFLCNGVCGRACASVGNFKAHPHVISLSLKLKIRGGTVCCNTSSNSRRKNPDFSRNGWQGFSRGRKRQTEERERDSFDNFDEPDMLLSNNGPLLSGNSRSPATSLPGPKEKEIVELFRKVQAQLRERAALKEEKKMESTGAKGKENETVDSLLKLLRKHSTERSRRNGITSEEKGDSNPSDEEKPQTFFSQNDSTTPRVQPIASLSRPPSKFRRVSPVPRVKYEPINIAPEKEDGSSSIKADINGSSVDKVEAVQELNYEPLSDPEAEIDPDETISPDATNYGVLEAELSESDVADDETDVVQEVEDEKDLTALKLVELRTIAKSRGLKGFSKMKKSDLLELLTEN
ncbi:hypothetical protein MLD38_038310 [Melastoma candidum]|uniref:Uncharacterized protein n=1 Tax=Melastoma candidum TaxID=119954 RepID=A0ACB9KYH6_9MYRT|nr:hypothetical protein MLD38_038310 [Melastoma candidum]